MRKYCESIDIAIFDTPDIAMSQTLRAHLRFRDDDAFTHVSRAIDTVNF